MFNNAPVRVNCLLGINQWPNTRAIIEWFDPIFGKCKAKFIKLVIVDFYSFISPKLFKIAIEFVKLHSDITEHLEDTICTSRFNKNELRLKAIRSVNLKSRWAATMGPK